MAINVLDSVIANRLSAGEVVECPASVVKELVDNSIDAHATNISIEIANGGIDYIKVSDNGVGIEESDLKKAFLPHATSKISCLKDLDSIYTLGFRGEALASIVSVSKLSITTKTDADDVATCLDVNGGEFGELSKVAGRTGTSIEVKNLFFNTPARRKFLKKPKQEENNITDVVSRFILANPTIKFKYVVEGKTILSSDGTNLLDAISCVYGMETAQNVLPIHVTQDNVSLHGYVSKISFTKPNTNYQTLLVNKRYVQDEMVSKAVYTAYQEFLMTRQFPFFVLNLDLPFTDVDVNVHPNKLAIKFAHPNQIFDLVYNNVRNAIFSFIKPKTKDYTEILSELPEQADEIEIDGEGEIYDTPEFDNGKIKFCQSFGDNISIFDKYSTNQNIDNPIQKKNESDIAILPQNSPTKNIMVNTIATELNTSSEQCTFDTPENNDSYTPIDNFSEFKIIGEIFNEFIILEYRDKMILMDFHAGHERLLYDQLTKQFASREIVIQDLLIPYVQKLTPKETDYILQFQEDFEKIGFVIDQISPLELRISSIPLLCKDINLKSFVDDLTNDINSFKPSVAYEIDAYLMRTACRSAVKAGQKLNDLQIKALLKDLDMKKPVLLCPHGRPIISIINRAQIEKWFKRIVN